VLKVAQALLREHCVVTWGVGYEMWNRWVFRQDLKTAAGGAMVPCRSEEFTNCCF